MSQNPATKKPPSPHTKIYNWKEGGPYRWKENFPLQAVIRARKHLSGGDPALEAPKDEN